MKKIPENVDRIICQRMKMLGHTDVRTTMIYTNTVRSRTVQEQKSPLDF